MYIYPIFGNTDINQITVDNIVDFRHSLIDKKLAQSTINGTITLIGTIFNSAIEDGAYNKANPIKSKKLKAFKLDNARDRYLTTVEINILLENIKENVVLYMLIKLALSTGGRVETILNIQKKDLNLDNGAINGTPIFTIQNLLNHSDIKHTMRYAKLAPDSGKNDVEDLYK
jgi:site-specific recombinase XerD